MLRPALAAVTNENKTFYFTKSGRTFPSIEERANQPNRSCCTRHWRHVTGSWLVCIVGTTQAAVGPISPLVFLAAAAFALPTALSYAMLNAEAPSAGAASTWLWTSISPAAGYLVGLAMTTYFVMSAVAQPILFGLFFKDLLIFVGLANPGPWALMISIPIVTIPVMWAAYHGAETSTRLAIILMTIECVVVVSLSLTILYVKGGHPGGINLTPFSPAAATDGFRWFLGGRPSWNHSFLRFRHRLNRRGRDQCPKPSRPKGDHINDCWNRYFLGSERLGLHAVNSSRKSSRVLSKRSYSCHADGLPILGPREHIDYINRLHRYLRRVYHKCAGCIADCFRPRPARAFAPEFGSAQGSATRSLQRSSLRIRNRHFGRHRGNQCNPQWSISIHLVGERNGLFRNIHIRGRQYRESRIFSAHQTRKVQCPQ